MYELAFSDQAMAQLNKLDALEQMPLIEALSCVSLEQVEGQNKNLGKFTRNGEAFYRLRVQDYRFYFRILDETQLKVEYILPQHSLSDFIFRFKLPVSEEQMVEQHQSFWKYLETLGK